MDTVKSSLATEKNEAGGMSADTRVVMDKLAAYLANSAVSAGCSDVLMGALSVSMYFRTSALSCALTHPPTTHKYSARLFSARCSSHKLCSFSSSGLGPTAV